MRKVKPNKLGIFPSFIKKAEPFDLCLGNGTRYTAILLNNPDSGGIILSLEGKGCYPFSMGHQYPYIAEKLGLGSMSGDAMAIADFIWDQIDPSPMAKVQRKRQGSYHADSCEDWDMWPDLGTVSHCTHREEDLIAAFFPVLHKYAPSLWERLEAELNAIYAGHFVQGSEEFTDDDDDLAYELSTFVAEDLFDAMNEIAAPWTTFGSSEGDGADFGYWICQEGLTEAVDNAEIYDMAGEGYDGGPSIDHDWSVLGDDYGYTQLWHQNGEEIWSA